MSASATSVGVGGCQGRAWPLPAQLMRHLQDQHLLLILDNAEHLLAGTPFLADVLSAAPRVKLLVTSREPLSLGGE